MSSYAHPPNLHGGISLLMSIVLLGVVFLFGGRLIKDKEKPVDKAEILAILQEEKIEEPKKEEQPEEEVQETSETALEKFENHTISESAELTIPALEPIDFTLRGSAVFDYRNMGTTAIGRGQKSITILDEKPKIKKRISPKIPLKYKNQLQSQEAKVLIYLDSNGFPTRIEILKSPNSEINQYIKESLKKWEFIPAQRGGKKAPYKLIQKITF